MKIHTLKVGVIRTNCYIVEDEKTKSAIVIDPGDDADEIYKTIQENKLQIKYIVITHGHFDHITGNLELKKLLNVPILAHKADLFAYSLTDSPLPDRYLEDGDAVAFGDLSFNVIHNPGHSPGGISLYCEKEKVIFTGDTLFLDTYGRVDLPHSSPKEMETSLKKLLSLPPETKGYPGHGDPTTIGDEIRLLEEI